MKKATISSFSSNPSKSYNVRSISLPPRSHPTILKIEEELNKLKAIQPTSSTSSSNANSIGKFLIGLKDLYKCIKDLLNLQLTHQAFVQHQNEKWVAELLDYSISYLDICGSTRDSILIMKESIREVQSAIRRRKVGDSSMESSVNSYICLKKKMKKEIGQSLATLKHMDNKFENLIIPLDLDHNHLSIVVRVLREACLVTSSAFRLLFLFLSTTTPLKSKPRKWLLVSMMVQKGFVVCDNQQKIINEFERVDMALGNLFVHNSKEEDIVNEKFQYAQTSLEILETSIERLENGLDCLFRVMIHNRVSLLNTISH